jgi:uncharacterized membrane protein
MLSSVSFHPFLSHLPIALYIGALGLLYKNRAQKHALSGQAASFNLSMGFIGAAMADFTGMISADINLTPNVEVEGHQGYSFLFTCLIGVATVYSFTRPNTQTAVGIYIAGFLALCATAFSGYLLAFPRHL